MLSIKELHERILYPVVRVRTRKAGGSGTVIYSKPNPKKPDEFQSFVLTCAHVVDDAIIHKEDWDSLLKKKIEKEFIEAVAIETFRYIGSRIISSNAHSKSAVIAYDKHLDLAIIELDSPIEVPFVAKLIPRGKIGSVEIFEKVYACGCSLGHDPFPNPGNVTYLKEMIDNEPYIMSNSDAIFGNSGGAVFLAETGEQLSVTARVTVTQLGFSVDVQTWMNFSVHPDSIYKFLDDQCLEFLYDDKFNYHECMGRRKRKEEEAKYLRMFDKKEEKGEISGSTIPDVSAL